ncbi:MAG: hypothetical protein J6M35_01100 [Clostridia bacterium]|nr:hypothetical protein [Clostridia bacterium]
MPWTLIIPSLLLAAGCIAIVVFSRREGYRLLLKCIDASAGEITDLTRKHIDVYERLYALIFFFDNDSSVEKQKFPLSDSRDMQEVFELNIQIDLEVSILLEKAMASEKLTSERSVSLNNLIKELEEYEKNLAPALILYNQQIDDVKKRTRFSLSKKMLKGLGECAYSPIIFPR